MVILGSFAVGSQLGVKQQLHPSKILGTRLEVGHWPSSLLGHSFLFVCGIPSFLAISIFGWILIVLTILAMEAGRTEQRGLFIS